MSSAFLVLSIVVPPVVTQGRVLVVDDSGGAPYTNIQAAHDAATNGDVLLLKSGSYPAFNVINKAIAVVADVGEVVQVAGTVRVRQLDADRDVLLHRLQVQGAPGSLSWQGTGLYLKNDQGSVRVQDCDLSGSSAHPGTQIEDCLDVSMNDCRSFGGAGTLGAMSANCAGGAGVSASGASLALYFSDVRGGAGGTGGNGNCQGCTGGSGLSSPTRSFLLAAGTLLKGHDGAPGVDGCTGNGFRCNGGYGGHGADLHTPFSNSEAQTLWSYDSLIVPGFGAFGGWGQCGCEMFIYCEGEGGESGVAVNSYGPDVVQIVSRTTPMLTVSPNPVREAGTVQLTYLGASRSTVLLSSSIGTSFRPVSQQGVWHTSSSAPSGIETVGRSDNSGQLTHTWTAPDLGPGVESRVIWFQPVFVEGTRTVTLGAPVGLVVLDSAF